MNKKFLSSTPLILVLLLAYSAYLFWDAKTADYLARQNRTESLVGSLERGNSLGQTFIPHSPDLVSIRVVLAVLQELPDGCCIVFVSLYEVERNSNLVAQTHIEADSKPGNYPILIDFRTQPESQNRTYLAFFQTNAPPDMLSLWGSDRDAYGEGSLFQQGQITERDLAFWTYSRLGLGSFGENFSITLSRALLLLAATLLYGLLGAGILFITRGFTRGDILEHLVLSLGLGFSLPPVLISLMTILRVTVNTQVVCGALILLAVLCVFRVYISKFKNGCIKIKKPSINPAYLRSRIKAVVFDGYTQQQVKSGLFVGALFFLALLTRLQQIDRLSVPNWMDGQIHQEILQLIDHTGGVPEGVTYHTGFHLNVYFLHLLSNLQYPELVLLTGQWASLLSGPAMYLLGINLIKSRRAALAAAVLFWFLTPFPSYLLSWSRFPFMAGLVLALIAVWTGKQAMTKRHYRLPAGLVFTGLMLTHYGSLVIAAAMMLFQVLAVLLKKQTDKYQGTPKDVLRTAGLVILPAVMLGLYIGVKMLLNQQTAELVAQLRFELLRANLAQVLQITLSHGGILVYGLGITGILIAYEKKRRVIRDIVGWCLVLGTIMGLQVISLGILLPSAVDGIIFLVIPLCLLSGITLAELLPTASANENVLSNLRAQPKKSGGLWAALLLVMGMAGGYNLSGVVDPSMVQFTSKDQKAMQWIKANSAPESTFLIHSEKWGNGFRPDDGGAWIEANTGRQIVYANTPEEKANQLRLAELRKVDFIYVTVGSSEIGGDYLAPEECLFTLVYDLDGIRIYAVSEEAWGIHY